MIPLALALLVGNLWAQAPGMDLAKANAKAYEDAYTKADVAALAAFFTDDAEYTAEDGTCYKGRTEIEACLSDALRLNKGAKLAITPESATPLTSDVMVEKGLTVTTLPSGSQASSQYTAVHVNKQGKWKMSHLVENPVPLPSGAERLSELTWLLGSWTEADKEAGVTIHSTYQAARGGNFLTRNVTVKRGAEPEMEGWQIIGWDPVAENIRSWTFDDGGGYSEGTWTRDGNRWLIREVGYAPDGGRTSADNTITKISEDKLTWSSANRTLNGDPLPSVGPIEIQRVKGGK